MKDSQIDRFTKNLRQIMKQRGIDAAQLSEKTGIPLPSIERILDEISSPNQAAIDKISEILDISVVDLIGEKPASADNKEMNITFSVTETEKEIIEAYRKLPDNNWLKQAIIENLLGKSDKNE